MPITGLSFLLFALAAVVLYYLFPKRLRQYVLLAASILFYLTYGVRMAGYLAATILLTYLFGLWLDRLAAFRPAAETKEERKRQKRANDRKKRRVLALARNLPEVKRIRFFMTFGQSYLTHMKCLENVGMLSTTPVEFNGQQIVPIQFLKTLLPDPASLGPRTVGKTNIGCIITGVKDGKEKTIYIYNVCDHQECYKELGCQAVAYTTGVPAMIGAAMVLSGQWSKKGVYTTDEFDPDPYMQMLNEYGLPWVVEENPETVA